jgi:hypothetical protein
VQQVNAVLAGNDPFDETAMVDDDHGRPGSPDDVAAAPMADARR